MERVKKFRTWLILFILLYLFVDFICFASIKLTYKNLNTYRILVNSPKIEITEAKGTYANGYIKGNLTNNTNNVLENKFIKVDLFSDRDVNLGTKYIPIVKLDLAKEMEFEVKYNYTDVSNYTIDIVDEKPEEVLEIKVDDKTRFFVLLVGLIVLRFAPFIP